jgi:hypothetical protein
MLDLVEKAFNEMTFLIKRPVVGPWIRAVGTGRNDRLHTALLHDLHERIRIVTLIADDGFGREFPDQPFRLPDIGHLPTGEDEGQGDGPRLPSRHESWCQSRPANGPRLPPRRNALLRPRRARVGTDYRTVNRQMLQVRFPRDMGLQLGPDAASLPPGKALEDADSTLPACRRQQPPLTTAAQHPQHRLQKSSASEGISHINMGMSQQKRQNHRPLFVGQEGFGPWRSAKVRNLSDLYYEMSTEPRGA